MIKARDVILFQGDSITDCGRARRATAANDLEGLGRGYAMMAASELLARRPADELQFYNRGISGNRVVDLYARIRCDFIQLRPTVISILIGVNDTWHEFTTGNGVAVPKYHKVYRELLTEIREALPQVRYVLCEPFVLPCGVVTPEWRAEMEQRRAVVHNLAREFGAVLVPFQQMFDEALQQAPAQYWAADGVHPTAAGHWLMAQQWLKCTGDLS